MARTKIQPVNGALPLSTFTSNQVQATAVGMLDEHATALDALEAKGILARNYTTASQGPGFSADTYLTNSNLLIPASGISAGMVFRWTIGLSKTANGTATAVFTARLGVALTTGDTSILALTQQTAQTAAVSSGQIIVTLAVRTGGATGVVAGVVGVAANTPGLGSGIDGVSGSVDLSAAAGKSLGLSINGGASAAWTVTSCTCELIA